MLDGVDGARGTGGPGHGPHEPGPLHPLARAIRSRRRASHAAATVLLAILPTGLVACSEGAELEGEVSPTVLREAGFIEGDLQAIADRRDGDVGDVDGDVDGDVAAPPTDADGTVDGDGDADAPPAVDDVDDVADADATDAADAADGGLGPDVEVVSCQSDADCLPLDDGNLCNGRWVCEEGRCVEDPESVECIGADPGPCRTQECDPATGECVERAVPNGTACDDGDPCTPNDRCEGGRCRSGPRLHCDDGNPCTEDGCEDGACTHEPANGRACDDGLACTTQDQCQDGRCVGGPSECTCSEDADCAAYGDGNPCNGQVRCIEGQCRVDPDTVVTCDNVAPGPCQTVACDPETGSCELSPKPDGSGCDDGDPCTVDDVCQSGSCQGEPIECEGGPCVDAGCDPDAGRCVPTPIEEGNTCSAPEGRCPDGICRAGRCVPDRTKCGCEQNSHCVAFDDDEACNGRLQCILGRCTLEPESRSLCPPLEDEPCKKAKCVSATGSCEVQNKEDGTPCDDGDPCTTSGTCQDGSCVTQPRSCDSGGPCTVSSCHPFRGCAGAERPVGKACSVDDPCVQHSACRGGSCVATRDKTCESDGPCTEASCDPDTGECIEEDVAGDCDDGDPCTVEDTCFDGGCVGTAKLCDDGNPCTNDFCGEDGTCQHEPTSRLCDDGNACTTQDVCTDDGQCRGTESEECIGCETASDCEAFDDGNPCTGDVVCDDGTCRVEPGSAVTCDPSKSTPCRVNRCQPSTGECELVPRAEGLPCDDGDPCTVDEFCDGEGTCDGEPRHCDDGNPCTNDFCDPVKGCVHERRADGAPCDDGNPCTEDTSCQDGTCTGTNDCPSCSSDVDCASVDDDDPCNGLLACEEGQCVVAEGSPVECEPSDTPCTTVSCNPETGACEETLNNGAACEDGDPCTVGDTCQGGSCEPGSTPDCDDGNPCTNDFCDPTTGTCVHEATGGSCDDGNPCTENDQCENGACVGGTNTCACGEGEPPCSEQIDDACLGEPFCGPNGCDVEAGTAVTCEDPSDSPCRLQQCDPETGECEETTLEPGTPCDDGTPCTSQTSCTEDGSCAAGEPVDCDDGNPCTEDSCDPEEGCVHEQVADGTTCDDGNPCTVGESCTDGECSGGTTPSDCFCGSADDCPEVSDACKGSYECQQGTCTLSDPVQCPEAPEPCRVVRCDPDTGACVEQNADDGTVCDDQDPCTINDHCVDGSCVGETKPCDDANPCTEDACDEGECTHEPADEGTECNDGDPCTVSESCNGDGSCIGGQNLCTGCSSDEGCAFADDGNECNGIWHCAEGDPPTCEPKPDSAVSCEDPDPDDCTTVECDPDTGECVEKTLSNGTPCDDGSVCTEDDACQNGQCVGTPTVTCSDPDPDDCVDSRCHPVLGICLPTPRERGADCDDGDACTVDDRCVSGGCQGTRLECDDDNPCTEDVCSAELGCIHRLRYGSCDDGNPCTKNTRCMDGTCSGGEPTEDCQCTVPSDCDFLEEDGNDCNSLWKCDEGVCARREGTAVECPNLDDEPCKRSVCDPETGECETENLPDGEVCDDQDPCTEGDRCIDGVCEGQPTVCDDGNPCTEDVCASETGACGNPPVEDGTACDDGNPCTGEGTCMDGVCQPGAMEDCPCTEDADCEPFDDDDLCNAELICDEGQCRPNPASAVSCPDDPTGCSVSTCNPETGECETEPAPDGASCNDGDPCTVDDRCQDGTCAGEPKDCDDDDPCTADRCDPELGCVNRAIAGSCDDGDPCTTNEVCVDGACQGEPKDCDDGNPCTADECVPGIGCRHTPVEDGTACEDGNPCTTDAQCQSGACVGDPVGGACACSEDADCEALGFDPGCSAAFTCNTEGTCVLDRDASGDCPEPGACSTPTCAPDTGTCELQPTHEGEPCDDGSSCTTDETCTDGTCTGSPTNEGGACDDGDPCTSGDTCTDGTCSGDPVETGGSCDDGDPCTVEETCNADGECVGQARTCEDPAGPCLAAECVEGAGCQVFETTNACDDVNACTLDDRCVAGACFGTEPTPPRVDFDDGDLASWSLSSTADEAGWALNGWHTASEPLALHAVNARTGSTSDPGGSWTATASWMPPRLPPGAENVELRALVRLDAADASCDGDVLRVNVDDAQVGARCETTDGDFVTLTAPLGDVADGAPPPTIDFVYEPGEEPTEGVVLDDLGLQWSCEDS